MGPITDSSMRRGWHLMACHTAPEFPEGSAKDAISLGVLLGAGSFGKSGLFFLGQRSLGCPGGRSVA